jgi:AcrR family transcriptional regulator
VVKVSKRKTATLELLADHILSHGLAASSLRPLAKAARVSDRMLLYYFKDKAEIITSTLELIANRLVILLNQRTAKSSLPFAQVRHNLLEIMQADDVWPYLQLWLEIASLSARGDALMRTIGEQIGRGFIAWIAAQLECPAEARTTEAIQLLIEIEGMVVLKSIGLRVK